MLACYPYYCQGVKVVPVYSTQSITGFEESKIAIHGAALPRPGRQKQFAFSPKENMTENTCRQGGTILSWWQVPPVIMEGEMEYPTEVNTAEKKSNGPEFLIPSCKSKDI